ncbi:AraC family transcriptional regulator [Novosphingobium sp. AAP83]|uniref:helix-turn-helix transcriptional regulator n=1 Tax=Novosphingobium sp. AAP83 TaxID=1523425 RepID=UPI0006B99B4F|nr:AraC family transcriptional regulator [Novosphingobium sp. AAP83]
MPDWKLPLENLATIKVAGQFLLTDRDFSTVHQGNTHALHLHGYAAEMRLAGEHITIAPGDLTLSPAGMPTMYNLPKPGRHWCIHFQIDQCGGPSAPISLHLAGCAHLREKFAHVSWQFATASDDIGFHAARIGAQDLLLSAARQSNPLPRNDAAAAAAQFIDNHFDRPIGLKEIAAAAGRSQVHLNRVFRQRFGITALHRLLQRRAEHARFLLESTDLPIWRVAERCGVPDAQHFNKFVKSMLGSSPSGVRIKTSAKIVDPDR